MNPEDYFQKPPESVFKNFSLPRIDDVLSGLKIRFANPATFNDPFEACPRFDLFAEEIAKSASEQLMALSKTLGISIPQQADVLEHYKKCGLNERVRFHSQKFQKECGEKFRMLCFSEIVHSPLMWGHYSECHAGFALKFDASHPFFHGRLMKVQYDTQRPQINDTFQGLSIPLTKNKDWSYEKEWRIVQEAADGNPHFENLPVESIKAVYFGLRMPSSAREKIKLLLNAGGYSHIQKFEMDLYQF